MEEENEMLICPKGQVYPSDSQHSYNFASTFAPKCFCKVNS